MEIKVIDDKKKRIEFQIVGQGNTFCNLLKDELWNDKNVTVVTYNIDHPLIGIPTMIVETDGEKSPWKALEDAAERIVDKAEKLKKEFKKEIR